MNAKNIKLGLFALASVAMLASCGSKGTSLTRAEAETELDTIAAKTVDATKLTYSEGWDKTTNSTVIADSTAVYAYRKFNTAVTKTVDKTTITVFEAGTEAFAYQDGDNYVIAYSDGTTKQYVTTTKDVATTYVSTFITVANSYANGSSGQAKGTANWLRGFDKTEKATGKTTLTTEDLNSLDASCTVKGYIGSESYTKYADGEMTANITAMYPYQQSLIDQGGENCIYEFKNYQLTRLSNNYQKYEEKFDWTTASTSTKIGSDYTLVPSTDLVNNAAVLANALTAFSYLAHGWSD